MKIYFLLFAGLLFLSGCTFSKTAKIDRLFQNYSSNCPGASVMVIQKGQPVLFKSYGMANLEKQIPVTPETNFRLASVTKQFTAMSIMLLVKENQLHLADQLTDIFPDFPK